MFHGVENLRGHNQVIEMTKEQLEEYVKCSQSCKYFSKYFYILQDKIGMGPMTLRPYQEKELEVLEANVPGKNNRIIMQGRQTGKTTLATLYLLWLALFNNDKTIAILANQESQALEILDRIAQAILALPLWLQQGINPHRGGWSKHSIGFDNGTKMFAAASSSASIRGKTVDYMLVDEFAHLEPGVVEPFMKSVFPTQSSRSDAKLILISTPLGMNHFYDIWNKAVNEPENSTFIPCKIQWWEVEGRDEEWKNSIIRNNVDGAKFFAQEYACLDEDEEITVRQGDRIFTTTMRELASMIEAEV